MSISFEKIERFAEILDPSIDFQLSRQLVEHRRDPLTGDRSIILAGRLGYVKHFFETDEKFLFDYAEETVKGCPFCPPSVEKTTPRFPAEIVREGRIKIGESVVFPSLFAHIEHNAVTALSMHHLLKLDEFDSEMLRNGIHASLEYVKNVYSKDRNVRYGALVVNYLPPAGSTVVHPHMQALASSVSFQRLDELLDASQAYFERSGSSYWTDIIEVEKRKNERYIGRIGTSEWFLPFSPKGFYEVDAILPKRTSFLELTGDDISSISEGLSRTLRYYMTNNIWSFNIAVYSGPLGVGSKHFAVNLRVVARYGFRAKWVNDRWALPFLLNEPEVFEAPEALTPAIKKLFS
jgi:UDPglucose--hexose-1-phosphate uridylyltransferase